MFKFIRDFCSTIFICNCILVFSVTGCFNAFYYFSVWQIKHVLILGGGEIMICVGLPFAALVSNMNWRLEESNRCRFNEKKLHLLKEEQLREQLKEGLRRERALREENESLRALLREKRMEASRMDEGVYLCTEHPEEW